MRTRHPPGQPNARQSGIANLTTGIKTGEAPSSEQKRTAPVKYTRLAAAAQEGEVVR